MKKPIRVLIVEDSEFDARILVNTLRQGGYDPAFKRVETGDAMRQALRDEFWEVVLSDYNLPTFSAPEALKVLQESQLDLPFIIISGGIGEDIAVAAMKAGAHDYLMKGNLARLIPAVEREMREAVSRQAGRSSEAALRDSEQRNRLLWENSTDAVVMLDGEGVIRYANPAVQEVFGHEAASVVGRGFTDLLASSSRDRFREWVTLHLSDAGMGRLRQATEAVGLHRDGTDVLLGIAFTQVELKGQKFLVAFMRDVTEQKQAEEESRLLQGISLAVGTAADLESALGVVLRAVCEMTGWTLGQAWLPSADRSVLVCSTARWCREAGLEPFRAASERLRLEPGQGMPGRAWLTRQPVWIEDLSAMPGAPRAAVAREVGVVAAAAIPVTAGDVLVAVIEFFLTERRAEDARLLKLFSAIAAQLGVAIQQKQGEKELRANEEEFRVARDIQDRLFPKGPPVIPGFEVAGMSRAASAAGGDYFDYLPFMGGGWGIAVGDVTGHGIGPALLMSETRAYLRVLALGCREVEVVLANANRLLTEDIGAERFITLLLICLDPVTRRLTYANAGHPAGYVVGSNGMVKHQLRRTGVPLGIRPDTRYPTMASIQLESGDVVVLMTDGIEEALGPLDAMFGMDRILEVVRAQRGRPARDVVEHLFREVQVFTCNEPQMDDATVVVVRVV